MIADIFRLIPGSQVLAPSGRIQFDVLKRNPNPNRTEIRQGIKKVLCRCTGYHKIVDAIPMWAYFEADKN